MAVALITGRRGQLSVNREYQGWRLSDDIHIAADRNRSRRANMPESPGILGLIQHSRQAANFQKAETCGGERMTGAERLGTDMIQVLVIGLL